MNRTPLLLGLALAITLLTGCYTSGVEQNWGRSQRVNFAAQVKHPEAPKTLDAPTGLDAVSGEQVIVGHRERTSDKNEKAIVPSLISIGSSLGGSR